MTILSKIDNTSATQTVFPPESTLSRIFKSVTEYTALKNRTINPDGHFDSAGRFYIDEGCSCCKYIARPTRSYPYGQMIHGRSLVHVAHKFQVENYIKIVRKAKSIYERLGDDACMTYLATEKTSETILAIDLGL
jgi:cell division protein FtsI/penicillin-binding protein 2